MKTHIIFVEPAQYTIDLIKNIYATEDITFFNSTSKAKLSEGYIMKNKIYYCDKNNFISNFFHFLKIGLKNDLIIINGYNHWSFLLLYSVSFFKKLHIGIESDTPYKEIFGLKRIIKTLYLKTIFKNKNILGFPGGNGLHRELFLNYGMDKERIFVLPMMVDNEQFYIPQKKRFSVNPTFLFVGRLDPEKNVQILVTAFKNTFQNNINANLLIIGTGECEKVLKKISGASDNIHFTGAIFGIDLKRHLIQADILVLASLFEPWGLVVNEAMCGQLAIICSSAVGAAKDLVVGPNSGWIFESDDQSDLEKVLKYCAENPEEVARRANNGYHFMKSTWNYDYYIKNLNKVKDYVRSH